MTTESDYRFPPALKDPDESLKVTLRLFSYCANFWRANKPYSLAEYVRPSRATGYSYECSTAGLTAAREPTWPTTLTATVTDGSVTWTCRAAGSSGLNVISSPSATSDPTGLTIGSVSVLDSTNIIATYSGGMVGQSYDAIFTFTLNGAVRIATQTVVVARR